MKNTVKIIGVTLALILFSCTDDTMSDETETASTLSNSNTQKRTTGSISKIWDFNDLNEWEDATQIGDPNYFIDNNGYLNIFTHANTYDRAKVKSVSTYATGTYSWRVYVPAMGEGDQASIGAFLYNNDTHELDFEIGYGKLTERAEMNAQADELLVYMTSQANPFQSIKHKIKTENWYTLKIELTLVNRKYHAKWSINEEELVATPLNYNSKFKFKIFCSVENLTFIGDHIPSSDNYAQFDWVEFKSN